MAGTQELESLLIKILGDATGLQNAMKQAEKTVKVSASQIASTLDTMGKGMQNVGKQMSRYVTAPIVAGLSASVYAFASFDDAMTKSTAIMGNISADLRAEMEATAMSISDNGVSSSKDLADAYFFLASAGLTAEEAMKNLPVVNEFATAGAFDLAKATDLLTDAQSALGMNLGTTEQKMQQMVKVSDVLVGANVLANASVEQFSEALTSKAGAALKTYGKSIEEGVSVLTIMADQGIKGAEAGTQLDRLTRLMVGASIANKDFHAEIGFSVFDKATGEMRPYHEIIRNITEITKGMTKETAALTITQMGFDARIQGVLLPLLGNADAMEENQKKLEGMSGYTKDVAEKNMASFAAQMKIVWNQIQNVAIEIGKKLAPHIKDLSEKLKKLIEWWKGLSSGWQDFIIIVGILVAVLGPAIFAMGTLLVIVGMLVKTTIFLTAAETIATIKRIAHTVATWLAVAAQVALKLAMMAIPFALFLTATVYVVKYAMEIYNANKHMKKLNDEKERGRILDDKMSKAVAVGHLKQTQQLGGMSGEAKTKALEAAIARSSSQLDDIAGNIQNAQKEADKLAPTWLSLGQAGKHVYEEQMNKVKSLDERGLQELEHYENMKKMLETHNAEMAAIQRKESGAGVDPNIIAKQTSALDELNASLIEQQATVGMTSSEIEVYRAKVLGASEEQLHSLRITQESNDAMEEEIRILQEEEEAIERRKDLYKNMNEQMDTQIATMNMSTAEIQLYTAAQEGLSDIELALLKIKSDKVVKMQEEKKLMNEGEKLTKAMRKPAEKLADGQEKLKEMLELGAISVETYGRAMEKLEKDMQVKVSFSVSGIDAVASGSLEAMARVEEFRALASEPNKVDFRKEGQEIVDAPKHQAEWEAEAAMWAEETRRQNTVEWKQKNTPNAPIDTAKAGLEFGAGMTYNDLPGAPQMNAEDEAEAARLRAEHLENIKIPLPTPAPSAAEKWQQEYGDNSDKPSYRADVHDVFGSGKKPEAGGFDAALEAGRDPEIEKETRDSNEIIAENTGKLVDAFGNISEAGL